MSLIEEYVVTVIRNPYAPPGALIATDLVPGMEVIVVRGPNLHERLTIKSSPFRKTFRVPDGEHIGVYKTVGVLAVWVRIQDWKVDTECYLADMGLRPYRDGKWAQRYTMALSRCHRPPSRGR